MNEKSLKTGVLGLDDAGLMLLEAASKVEFLDIQAVADKNSLLVEKIAVKYDCQHFDDYRQFIMQSQLDCVLVAAGMHNCDEYIRMAMKKKIHILKLPPAAANFEQALTFTKLANQENTKFVIATPLRFSESFLALRQYLHKEKIEHIYLLTAACNTGYSQYPAWQTDPKLSGGGVLLRNCYNIIDLLTWNFTMPQNVYSVNTNHAQDRQQRLARTEDLAVVTMKFADNFFANIITILTNFIISRKTTIF